ncbi:MAG: alpha/beta fold hydrolase [Balneolaceae bacterium]|nr:alpha/beta fold hydrolase [Balneolaceae bacterium]MBO6545259.1 alpha/beta fold hydrolase [Balneolaceae bacterium]MBO6646655.1 alpha/beta fold hydrolase [Balneolaceae bacterium]
MSLFSPKPFKPAWWAFNGHVHTVVSSFSKVNTVQFERIEIDTSDNDFLEIDLIDLKKDQPVVALFHGLEGSSERFYIRSLMHDLQSSGYSSVALNFRGCGSRLNEQRRFYHSGETSDYATFFNWIKSRFPENLIYAVGFSLGGNALIKSLGEEAGSHPVTRAVAVSPPYDLKAGSLNLEHGFNKVYAYRFLKTLAEKLERKRIKYPDLPAFNGDTLYEFDDRVTAPIHGFDGADHYYETCSSKQFLADVQTPLLLIHSKEDTLCPLQFAPFEMIEKNPFITRVFTEKGGHVGFISSPRNWINETILHWLQS